MSPTVGKILFPVAHQVTVSRRWRRSRKTILPTPTSRLTSETREGSSLRWSSSPVTARTLVSNVLWGRPFSIILKGVHFIVKKKSILLNRRSGPYFALLFTSTVELMTKWAVVVAQVVAQWTTDWEVLSLIPTGNWAFFLLSSLLFPISISGAPLISSLTEVQHYLFSIFQVKMEA